MKDPAHSLFNEKTIQRLCSNESITEEQIKRANQWIDWIKKDLLRDEVENYNQFAVFILQKILGYDTEKYWKLNRGKIEFSFLDHTGEKGVGIEAKGMSCKDLFAPQRREKSEHKTPIKQLWDYMGENDFDYGICTNYRYFVLIDRSKGYSKYHILDFLEIEQNKDKLKEFVAIFSKKNIIDNNFLPKLYEESILEEREFTKQFYKLYHETRLMLIKEFMQNISFQEDALHYAQLFLNRIIFIFFAEDTGKLPSRLFSDTINKYLDTKSILNPNEYSTYVSDAIKNLFERLDKGSHKPIEIFGFNGGLFRQFIPPAFSFKDSRSENFFNEVLLNSNLKKIKLDEKTQKHINGLDIDLNPIIRNLLLMSSFAFQTELNVNILGHIFEQSLTDLEELKESKDTTKRKREGIYYTPDFITDYICKNTIIPYLSKKGVNDIDDLITEYKDNIEDLEKKFQEIKILDPACGSGAFLLKTVDVLLEIHKKIQIIKESIGKYTVIKKNKKSGEAELLSLEKWNEQEEARKIIENNIFGVDINEESVEITRLSLFLKIASDNRKLIDLTKNIRVGNSLIEDSNVSNKAFIWKIEFEDILLNNKFDIIIGNPPYVRVQELKYKEIDYFKSNYKSAYKRVDISILFYELAYRLIKENGKVGLISSSQFITAEYGRKLRKLLLENKIEKFVNFGSLPVFENVITYPTIIIFSKCKSIPFNYYIIKKIDNNLRSDLNQILKEKNDEYYTKLNIDPITLTDNVWNFLSSFENNIKNKLTETNGLVSLGSFANPSTGLTTGLDEILILDQQTIAANKLETNIFIKVLRGRNIEPWYIKGPFDYSFYPYTLKDESTTLCNELELQSKFPNTYNYLSQHKEILKNRKDSRKTVQENKQWFSLIRKGQLEIFKSKKIVTPALTKHNSFAIDEGSAFITGGAGVFGLIQDKVDNRYLLAILNSKLIEYFLHEIASATKKQNGYYSYLNTFLSQIPIRLLNNSEQQSFIEIVNEITSNLQKIQSIYQKFHNRAYEEFSIFLTQKKIETLLINDFYNFLLELNKKHTNQLSLKKKDEWEEYFNIYKNEILNMQNKVKSLIDQLDDMVFNLYNLTYEEKLFILKNINR